MLSPHTFCILTGSPHRHHPSSYGPAMHWMPLPLANCNKLFFQWQSSLIYWPHHIWILKILGIFVNSRGSFTKKNNQGRGIRNAGWSGWSGKAFLIRRYLFRSLNRPEDIRASTLQVEETSAKEQGKIKEVRIVEYYDEGGNNIKHVMGGRKQIL